MHPAMRRVGAAVAAAVMMILTVAPGTARAAQTEPDQSNTTVELSTDDNGVLRQGGQKDIPIRGSLKGDRTGLPESVTITVRVDVSDITPFSTVYPLGQPCARTGDVFTCVRTTSDIDRTLAERLVALRVVAKQRAAAGRSGKMRMTADVTGGSTSSKDHLIRVHQGVYLGATSPQVSVKPGRIARLDLRARNSGDTAVEGTVMVVRSDRSDGPFLRTFNNCRYGTDSGRFASVLACTLPYRLAPGRSYSFAPPPQVRVPADAIGGSVGRYEVRFFTRSDFARYSAARRAGWLSRTGKGAALALKAPRSRHLVPQTNIVNGGGDLVVKVTGSRKGDPAAVARVVGRQGDRGILARVGFVNKGRGGLYGNLFANNRVLTKVRVPIDGSVQFAQVDERCRPESAPPEMLWYSYLCESTVAKVGGTVLFDVGFELAEGVDPQAVTVSVDRQWFQPDPTANLDSDKSNNSTTLMLQPIAR